MLNIVCGVISLLIGASCLFVDLRKRIVCTSPATAAITEINWRKSLQNRIKTGE